VAAQPGEESLRNTVGLLPGRDCVFDDEFVLLVELGMVDIIEHVLDSSGRDALDDEKRCVMCDAIITSIQFRNRDDCQFEKALWQCFGFAQLDQHRHQVAQRGRDMREHRHLVSERAVVPGKALVDRGEIAR